MLLGRALLAGRSSSRECLYATGTTRKQKKLEKLMKSPSTQSDLASMLDPVPSQEELSFCHNIFHGSARFERAFSSIKQLREASGDPVESDASSSSRSALPFLLRPQVAFAGRSNVGKSSLLNAVMGHGSLARVSSTPGHTRTLNFFSISNKLTLVDLPGYGHTSGVSHAMVEEWLRTMGDYLAHMTRLECVWLLIDSRREPSDLDRQCRDFLKQVGTPMNVVLTKADKLASSPAELHERIDSLRYQLELPGNVDILVTSSTLGLGIPDLRTGVLRRAGLSPYFQASSAPASPPSPLASPSVISLNTDSSEHRLFEPLPQPQPETQPTRHPQHPYQPYRKRSQQLQQQQQQQRRSAAAASTPRGGRTAGRSSTQARRPFEASKPASVPEEFGGNSRRFYSTQSRVLFASSSSKDFELTSEPTSSSDVLAQMRRLLSDGSHTKPHQVVEMVESQLVRFPKNLALRELLSDAHLTAGEYKAGIDVCRSLLAEKELADNKELRFRIEFRLAECAHRLGDLALAAPHYRQALELAEPSDYRVHMRYAFMLLSQSEVQADLASRQHSLFQAEQYFSECMEQSECLPVSEQDVELFYGRALTRIRLRRIDDALDDLTKGLEVDDQYPPLRHKLAESLMAKGSFDEAVKHLDFFIDNHQTYYQSFASHDDRTVTSEYILSDALLKRARCLIQIGEESLAAPDLEAVVKLHVEPLCGLAFHFRGLLALKEEDYEKCIDDNTKALEIVGTFLPAFSDRADAYRALGRIEEANNDLAAIEALREEMRS